MVGFSKETIDDALVNSNALVSKRIKHQRINQQQQTVGVLVHGFSASSYEFRSLKSSWRVTPLYYYRVWLWVGMAVIIMPLKVQRIATGRLRFG